MHDYGMFRRHEVQVADVERTLILELRVVEEVSLDPRPCRSDASLRAQLLDDAGNGDEFDLEGIADEDFIEERRPTRMAVAVDEARHDRHLLRVERLRAAADESSDVGRAPDGDDAGRLHRERFRARKCGVHRIDLRIEHDEIWLRT